MNFLRLKTAK